MLKSLRVRLTVWYVLLLAIILAAFSAGLYLAVRSNIYGNLDDSLDARSQVLGAAVTFDGNGPTLSGADAPADPQGETFARVFDSSGQVTFDNTNANTATTIDQRIITAALHGQTTRANASSKEENLLVLTRPITRDGATAGVLQVGISREDARDTLSALLFVLAVGYPLTLILASAGGVFLAGRALAPIDRLTRVARRISAEDLHQRIDLEVPDDEVGRLARTFNDMIARLDDAFERQRQFTAHASHELRTPLTVIKGQTEVALQRDRDVESYQRILEGVNLQVDRMIRMSQSLLVLARADAGQLLPSSEPVEIGGVVREAVDQLLPAAEAKSIEIAAAGTPATTSGDRDLLLQLLLNLLDNAVKYTPDYGFIRISWSGGDEIRIDVSDTGQGIPDADLPHIFERFYRADKSRTGTNAGAGLGLSIASWIAEAHGGRLDVQSKEGLGSTFSVRLPANLATS
jgi:heavy metal sensor kinase